MLGWAEFATVQPEMASFGEKRLQYKVMYLATIRPDGYPRVHPFTPFIGSGRLFAFMYPSSPKGKDLQRNGRYSMHSLVADENGTNGEFQISGNSLLLTDSASLEAATASCPYKLSGKYILFEFKIDRCFTNYYTNGTPNMKRWKEETES
jgi:hypothetical protein